MLAITLTSIWLILVLVAIGLLLVVAEVFIPSGGVIGILGGALIITAIVGGFMRGPGTGIIVLVAGGVLTPVCISAAVKMLPRSKLGTGIVLGDDSGGNERAVSRLDLATAADRSALVGKRGKVVRDLRPAGVILLDGQRVEVVSEGEFLESGTEAEVIRIEGRTVVVGRAEGSVSAEV